MTTPVPLILCCLWIVVANAAGMLSGRRGRWPAAVALIATGIPLLGYVTLTYGPLAGFLALGAGASILRWPIRLGVARLRRGRRARPDEAAGEPQPHLAE